MSAFAYGLYILIWPAITLAVLIIICTATYRDAKKAKAANKRIVQQSISDIDLPLSRYKSILGYVSKRAKYACFSVKKPLNHQKT